MRLSGPLLNLYSQHKPLEAHGGAAADRDNSRGMEFDSVGKSSQIRPRINPPLMPIAEDQLQAIALRVQFDYPHLGINPPNPPAP